MAEVMENLGGIAFWSTQHLVKGRIAHDAYRLFSVPRGQSGQGFNSSHTAAETNLTEGGRLPGGMAFVVDTVSVAITAALDENRMSQALNGRATDAIDAFAPHCMLQWAFLQTRYNIAPLLAMTPVALEEQSACTRRYRWRYGGEKSSTSFQVDNVNVTRVGGDAVVLPAHTTFGVRLVVGASPPLPIPLNVCVTLSGDYK